MGQVYTRPRYGFNKILAGKLKVVQASGLQLFWIFAGETPALHF
jgi:hypothetical protein